jgi:hypothetical protein
VLPKPNKLPKDMYHSKTIIKGLGMDYEKIDVCKNNCMLFMKEHVWGIDIPWVHQRSKRPHERPRGPIIRKVILSWA